MSEPMSDESQTGLNARIEIRAPVALRGAVDRAAREKMMSAGAYVRGALLERLIADGVRLEGEAA
jgi:hypothetical protein